MDTQISSPTPVLAGRSPCHSRTAPTSFPATLCSLGAHYSSSFTSISKFCETKGLFSCGGCLSAFDILSSSFVTEGCCPSPAGHGFALGKGGVSLASSHRYQLLLPDEATRVVPTEDSFKMYLSAGPLVHSPNGCMARADWI